MGRSFSSVKKQDDVPAYYKELAKRKKPTLHLVDGNNWACRAYYAWAARTNLVSKSGQTVFGVAGFVQMVGSMVKHISMHDDKELYLGLCFDPSSSSTWRYEAQRQWVEENKKLAKQVFASKSSPLYKGTRDRTKTPDLGPQIDLMREVMDANGFTVLRKAPYEGDDLIGTLSQRFAKKCFVDMYSIDKDYVQLVTSKMLRLIMQAQSNRAAQVYDHKTARTFFGVEASQIVDFLAMAGDSVDNVPGIVGIAEKTAQELLAKWGSYDNLARNIDQIKGNSRWKKAIKGEFPMMHMDLQQELVTIDLNVPRLPQKLEAFKRREPDEKRLTKLARELKINVRI